MCGLIPVETGCLGLFPFRQRTSLSCNNNRQSSHPTPRSHTPSQFPLAMTSTERRGLTKPDDRPAHRRPVAGRACNKHTYSRVLSLDTGRGEGVAPKHPRGFAHPRKLGFLAKLAVRTGRVSSEPIQPDTPQPLLENGWV